MNGPNTVSPGGLAAALAAERGQEEIGPEQRAAATAALVKGMLARRREFGITRLGSITRLDRAGVAVAQAVRPEALSNVVAQGKGFDLTQAAVSALMEALETWSGEHIDPDRLSTAAARDLDPAVRDLYASGLIHRFDVGWDRLALPWIEGWDLLTDRPIPVPAALVDTVYTYPSPHPALFPRTTTGLAAGPTLHAAIIHAGLEVLERDSVALAARQPDFFDRSQLDGAAIDWPVSARLLARIGGAGLRAGIWLVPSSHGLPVYWCHVVEAEGTAELVPLPGEGFGCDFTHDAALAKALLEACQARATAIGGAREDITRRHYPDRHDRELLASWRQRMVRPERTIAAPCELARPRRQGETLERIVQALRDAGAKAALVVPLLRLTEPMVQVVRLVAPPLRHGQHG